MTVEIPEDWQEEPGLAAGLTGDQLARGVEWFKDVLPAIEERSDDNSRLLAAIFRQRLRNREEELRRRAKSQTKPEVKSKPKTEPKARSKSQTKPRPFFPREVIDRVKDVSVLEYVTKRFGAPTRRGETYVALCPLHQGKNPSFTIYPQKNSWYCYGCGRGGDIINLVRELDGLRFVEAMEHLAPMAGESVSPPEETKMRGNERVRDEAPQRRWFTQMPNIVLQKVDDPYEGWLLFAICKVAGDIHRDGICRASTWKLAKLASMDESIVLRKIYSLAEKGLIKAEFKETSNGWGIWHITPLKSLWEEKVYNKNNKKEEKWQGEESQ